MARAPNKNLDKAYELYKSGMKLVEIASQLSLPPGTVRRWKSTYNWDNERSNKNNERSQKKEKDNKAVTKEIKQVLDNTELTEKQRLFCIYYLKNFNATLAAVRAGYSSDNASSIGYQLLQKTTVRAEIQRLKEAKAASIMLSEDDIIERYMRIAFADMTDFVEFGEEEQPIIGDNGLIEVLNEDTGQKEFLTEKVNVIKFKSSHMVDGGLICEISQGRNGSKIKLEDRQKALDWLAKYFLMNPMDQHKVEYDKRKLEIELIKAESEIKANEPESSTNDENFIDALNATAKDVWSDEE